MFLLFSVLMMLLQKLPHNWPISLLFLQPLSGRHSLLVAKQREQVVKYKSLLTHKCQKKQLIPWGCSTSLLGPILGFRTSILAWEILGQVASSVIFGAEEKKGGGKVWSTPRQMGSQHWATKKQDKKQLVLCVIYSVFVSNFLNIVKHQPFKIPSCVAS